MNPIRVPIVVPDLQTGSEKLMISGWLVEAGDLVINGDLIVEVLIPGISLDLIAESTGRLVEIVKPVDALIQAGDIIGWLETEPMTNEAQPDPV
jgi:pyruvate/2-oxoglutarate dehydrogenase complex dihydrolipoamide acyltransferase (E2) component